ncbi:hypothetical protein Tco_0070973 [Tanacetum coccineum]
MRTKTELTFEQTQQGTSDEVLNIRVIPHSIHSDDGNPTSANIKQALRQLHPRIHQKHWTDPGDGGSVGRTSCSPGTDLNFKSQVKDNKIDLLVQQYEQFTILEETSIDSGFARFNTIITSLKALDEDLSSLALDELIENLKVHKVFMEKDFEIYKGKKEQIKSIALKAKKESSDDETLTSGSDDEEYVMAVRNFKKFFRRMGKFVRQPREERKSLRQRDEKKGKSDRKCFRCELNEKIKKLERSKEIEMTCKSCDELKLENAKLKETQVKFVKFDKSANSLREMLNNQNSPSCKIGLGFDSDKASTSGTKTLSFVGSFAKKVMDRSTIKGHGSTLPGFVSRKDSEKGTEHVFSPPMSSRSDFVITRKKLIHNSIDESKKSFLEPSLKSGYSQNSKACVVLNKHTIKVEESLNVTFDESPPPTKLSPLVDDDVGEEEAIRKNTKVVNTMNEEDESIEVEEIINIKESKNHPLDQVIGNLNQRTLRPQAQNHSNFFCFISTIEPINVNEALKDESWVVAMQEELNQFVANLGISPFTYKSICYRKKMGL